MIESENIDHYKGADMDRHTKSNGSRGAFSSRLGFVLAAAGSAVGLGNIWRFPYLAARDGGGLFLVIYIILALTFGFTLLTTEVAIGRKTGESPLTAYAALKKGWGPLGYIACLIPMVIMPYYCVIGGWVLKYLTVYATGSGEAAAADGYFAGFITSQWGPLIFMAVFMALTAVIVILGVDTGIEKLSKVLMPALLVIIVIIAVFSLTISHTDDAGMTRNGLEGLTILFIPDLEGITVTQFLRVVMDAMGQLFYSLSIAMGIMIAYGSYMPKDTDLSKSINQIEIFDTAIAILAGVMIIPTVFVFMGRDGMQASGPGLMFQTLPRVFTAMGGFGWIIGVLFFAMVLFAAVTSSVSILEAIVSSIIDRFHISRKAAVGFAVAISFVLAVIVCLGYNVFYFDAPLPNGAVGQILDIFDYISNNVLMPILSILTCILVGWIIKPEAVTDEVELGGAKMGRKGLYRIMVRFVAPILLLILLLQAVGLIK